MARFRTGLEIDATFSGAQSFQKAERQIQSLTKTSSKAIQEQLNNLKKLTQRKPSGVERGGASRLASKTLGRLKELGSQAKATGGDVADANQIIAQSIKRVTAAIKGASQPRTRPPRGMEPSYRGAPRTITPPPKQPETPAQFYPEEGRFRRGGAFAKPTKLEFAKVVLEQLKSLQTALFEYEKSLKIASVTQKGFDSTIAKSRSTISQLSESFGFLQDDTRETSGYVQRMAERIKSYLENIGPGLVKRFGTIGSSVKNVVDDIHGRILGFTNQFQKAFATLSPTVNKLAGELMGALAPALSSISGLLSTILPVIGQIAGAAIVAFDAIRTAVNTTINVIKSLIKFLRNLVSTLIDVAKFVYRATSAVIEFTRSVASRAIGAVRTFTKSVGNLISRLLGLKDANEQASGSYYTTVKRSYQTARAVDTLSSAMQGVTVGISVARMNIIGLAMGAYFLRRAIIGIMAPIAGLTAAIVGLSDATKMLVTRITEAGKTAQDVIRNFSALTHSVQEGTQAWIASAHWAVRYGQSLEETRSALTEFWQKGMLTNDMMKAAIGLSAAWNMELSEAVSVLTQAVGKEEGQIETLREYGVTVEGVTNETERLSRATAVAESVIAEFKDETERYLHDISGAINRARASIQWFWEVFTEPLASKVVAPLVNAFANFVSTISSMTMALWKSRRAQEYFNETLSKARQLVERFRPEITILGNIVRSVVAAAFWSLQLAMRAVVNVAEHLMGWVRNLFAALKQLTRPIKPLADMFRMLSQSWKELSFTELLLKAKEFVFDFPITLAGIKTTLGEMVATAFQAAIDNIWEWAQMLVAAIGTKILGALVGLDIGSITATLVTILLDWIGRTAQVFLTDAYPEFEDMFTKMFDLARWTSMIGGAFFGIRGALIGYLGGLLLGWLDESFSLGIHDWVSQALTDITDYFVDKWGTFWDNAFERAYDPAQKRDFGRMTGSMITGVNFDKAFQALFKSFKDDWNNIFKPAIREFLGMEEGATAVSDYIGAALLKAIEGAGWIAKVMVKLFNAIVDAWDEYVVPAWRDYIQPEIQNLWDNYLREPLTNLMTRWQAFWNTFFGREYEAPEIDYDVKFHSEDWVSEADIYSDMQKAFEDSEILSSLQTFGEKVDEIIGFFEDAREPTANFATAVWNLGEATWHLGRGIFYLADSLVKLGQIGREIMNFFNPFYDKSKEMPGIMGWFARKTENLKIKLGNWADKLEIAHGFIVDVRNVLRDLGGLIRDVITGNFGDLEEDTDNLNESFGGLWGTWEDFVNRWMQEQISPWLGYFWAAYDELFGNTWSSDMEKGWDDLWGSFKGISDKIDEKVFKPIRTAFNDFRDTYFPGWKRQTEGKWDSIFGSGGTFNNVASQVDTNILEPMRGFFNNFRDEYFPTWKSNVVSIWNDAFGEEGAFKKAAGAIDKRVISPITSAFTTFKDETWPDILGKIEEIWTDIFGNPDTGDEGLFVRAINKWLGNFGDWVSRLNREHGPLYTLRVAFQAFEGVLAKILEKLNKITGRDWDIPDAGGGGGSGGGGGGFGNGDEAPLPEEEEEEEDTPTCFVSGTKISMIDGHDIPIEKVGPGDVVLSFDPGNHQFLAGVVTSAFSREVDSIYTIETDSATIEVTGEHPIYMPDSDKAKVHDNFVRVKNIEIGDTIFLEEGNDLVAEEVFSVSESVGSYTVHNISVQGCRTYIAGGVAVHNKLSLQRGGIVTRPVTATVGEVPEAIIPLQRGRVPVEVLGGGGINITIEITGNTFGSPQDAKEVADITSREILRRLRSRGVMVTGRF